MPTKKLKRVTQEVAASELAEHLTWEFAIGDVPHCAAPGCEHRYTRRDKDKPPFPEDVAMHNIKMLALGGYRIAQEVRI